MMKMWCSLSRSEYSCLTHYQLGCVWAEILTWLEIMSKCTALRIPGMFKMAVVISFHLAVFQDILLDVSFSLTIDDCLNNWLLLFATGFKG